MFLNVEGGFKTFDEEEGFVCRELSLGLGVDVGVIELVVVCPMGEARLIDQVSRFRELEVEGWDSVKDGDVDLEEFEFTTVEVEVLLGMEGEAISALAYCEIGGTMEVDGN